GRGRGAVLVRAARAAQRTRRRRQGGPRGRAGGDRRHRGRQRRRQRRRALPGAVAAATTARRTRAGPRRRRTVTARVAARSVPARPPAPPDSCVWFRFGGMTRFVQAAPELRDPYATDRQLLGWLDRLLGPDGHAAAKDRLAALAADVLGPLRAAHHDAETHPPTLTRYDAWGGRIDRIDTAPGWERLRVAAAEHALVALPYADFRRTWGAGTRIVQFALLYLYGPESATYTCPVAMSDGAAAL